MVVLVALAAFQLARPLPRLDAEPVLAATQTVPGAAPQVPWPAAGIAAIGATEIGLIAASPAERPLPMLSIAKVMTALQVLADHPLKPGEQGPPVTVTASDVQDYQAREGQKESVVAVQAGEQLSEYQLLQGLLIPSGNNFGDILAEWDAGGVPAFVQKLNDRARLLGMKQTTYADPAGVDDRTAATPSDLARQAAVAIGDPVIAEIVAQPQATLPVAGIVYNVDYALGAGGISGIKTGSGNGSAGFMFASPHRIAGKQLTVVGAVMGLPTLDDAFAAARKLIDFAKQTLVYDQVLRQGDQVARYPVPWQSAVPLDATQSAYLLEWPGMKVTRRLRVPAARVPMAPDSAAGEVDVGLGDQLVAVPLETGAGVARPPTAWRLTRLG